MASSATPVLLLHGFMGSSRSWPEPLVAALAQDRTVIAPDLPGHGSSDASALPDRYDIVRVAGDLASLLDHLAVERAHVVGYSMGGRLALAFALTHPARVRRLVLESASPGLASDSERSARRLADDALSDRLTTEPFEAFIDDWMALPLFESQKALGSDWLDVERTRRLKGDPTALAACLRGMGTGTQPSYWPTLAALEPPTLLLTGDLDEKFCGIARQMAELSTVARSTTVPGAGHRVHAERPEAWLDHVSDFLRAY